MIGTKTLGYTLTTAALETARTVILRSGAVEYILNLAAERRGVGGRPSTGVAPGLGAVLTVWLAIIRIGRVPSVAESHRALEALDAEQREFLGIPEGPLLSYAAFHAWLTRLLEPLDSGADLPARRITNREQRARVAERSLDQRRKSADAAKHRHRVVNLLIAGSIDEPTPEGSAGDIVADETIIDLAGSTEGLGTKPEKHRGAAYIGGYYMRDRTTGTAQTGGSARYITKQGFGIGVTAVSRIGSPSNLYGIAPVITGIAIHAPTSGSLEGLALAIAAHKENGFDGRRSKRPNAKLPNLVVDMGYSVKTGFSSLLLDEGYAPVVRFPKNRQTVWASDNPDPVNGGQPAGPLQIDGVFYCPSAISLVKGKKPIGRLNDLLADKDGFDARDRVLKQLFPLMMGTNSRPRKARVSAGRPSAFEEPEEMDCYKIELVCPAVQGRVKCLLKPQSLVTAFDKPEVEPTWEASRYRCCSQSQLTLTYSEEQWKLAQWGLVPGSWEHAIYYEAARSLTEQQFSRMKSQHVTGIDHLKWSPKREPLLTLIIALWVAATNLAIQDKHYSRPVRRGSVAMRHKQLEKYLGRPPVKTPPRT